MENFSKCTICHNLAKHPKHLPCLHTFCLSCLEDYCDREEFFVAKTQSYLCPNCRSEFKLPEGGCDKLPTNLFVEKLSKDLQSTPEIILCTMCGIKKNCETASVYCFECGQFFCKNCEKRHSADVKHVAKESDIVIQLEFLMTKTLQDRCRLHSKKYELYCENCSEPVCIICITSKHNRHTMSSLDEACTTVRAKLHEEISLLKNMSESVKIENMLNKDINIIETKIRSKAKQLREKIDADEKALLNQLDMKSACESRTATGCILLNKFEEFLNAVLRNSTDINVVIESSKLLANSRKLLHGWELANKGQSKKEKENMKFVEADRLKQDLNIIGNILIKDTTPIVVSDPSVKLSKTLPPPISKTDCSTLSLQYSIKQKSEINLSSFPNMNYVINAITTLDGCLYISCANSSELIVYDAFNLDFIGVVKITKLKKPSHFVSSQEFLFISDDSDHLCFRLTVQRNIISKELVASTKQREGNSNIHAMTISLSNNLLIAFKLDEVIGMGLMIMEKNQEMDTLRLIIYPDFNSIKKLLSFKNMDASYFVSDGNNVQEESVRSSRDLKGHRLENVKNALALFQDDEGNCILCCDDRVMLLNQDFKFIRNLHQVSIGEKLAGLHFDFKLKIMFVFYKKSGKIDIFHIL